MVHLAFVDQIVKIVVPGLIVGGIAAWVFFWWFERHLNKIRSTEGRAFHKAGEFKFGFPSPQEALSGGALDGCYTRKDQNVLSVRIDEGQFLLEWRNGDAHVGAGRFDDEAEARAWFDWCKERISTGRLRLAGRRGRRADLARRAIPMIQRECIFHRDAEGRFEITWTERGSERFRLFLQHEPEGQELLDLLATGARHPLAAMC